MTCRWAHKKWTRKIASQPIEGFPSGPWEGQVEGEHGGEVKGGSCTRQSAAPPKKTWALKSAFCQWDHRTQVPREFPRTTAVLPFRNVSSWPCSLAVCAWESQDNVVYCFNICLTQSKPSSGDSLSVICVSVKEISRQIRCLGAHCRMAGFATSIFCRRETRLKKEESHHSAWRWIARALESLEQLLGIWLLRRFFPLSAKGGGCFIRDFFHFPKIDFF